MSFYVACECGRAFEVEDGHTAPAARCPDCGRDVPVAAPPPGTGGSEAEPVETVDAERAGARGPEPPPAGPPPRTGTQFQFGGPAGPAVRASGTGCLLLLLLLVGVSIAVPQFGAAVAGGLLGCCVLPILVVGVMFWWRLRQFKKMLDPNRRPPPDGGGPSGPGVPFG
jgi:hypothetical protein